MTNNSGESEEGLRKDYLDVELRPIADELLKEWWEFPQGWNSFDNGIEQYPGRKDIRFRHELGFMNGVTGVGGPESKYKENEDGIFYWAKQDTLVAGVVDGAGGSVAGGRLASKLATQLFIKYFEQGLGVEEAFNKVNTAILRQFEGRSYATASIILIEREKAPQDRLYPEDYITIASVGDCGVLTNREVDFNEQINFVLHGGKTDYQNLAQSAVDTGYIKPEEYYNFRNLNVITGGIGLRATEGCQPSIRRFRRAKTDVFVLYSDGIGDLLSPFEIARFAARDCTQFVPANIYAEAFKRNNSKGVPFKIEHEPGLFIEKSIRRGDNLSVLVVQPFPQDYKYDRVKGDYVKIKL